MLDLLEEAETLIYSDPDRCLELVQRAEADPTLRVRAGTVRAIALARRGDVLESVSLGMRLLEEPMLVAQRARLLNVVGAARDLLGQTEAAVGIFAKALSLSPPPELAARLHVNLGVALARLSRHREALEHLEAAIPLTPGPERMARVKVDIAISRRELGDHAASGLALEEAARLAGDAPTRDLIEHQQALLQADTLDPGAALARLHALTGQEIDVHLRAATWAEIAEREPDIDAALTAASRALGVLTDTQEWAIPVCETMVRRLRSAGRFDEALMFYEQLHERTEAVWKDRVQTELALLQVQLEVDRLRDESEGLARANRELAQLVREQDEFMAIASHDLRSPLTAIQMTAQMLSEQGVPMADTIVGAGHRMEMLVNQMIEAHAAETLEPMSTGPTAVHEVAGEVCRSLAITAAEKGARLQVRGRGSCDCDPDALARVLINLVENALKFGATEVEVVCGSQGVDVLDNGPGFTEEDLGRAFSKFARLSARPTGGEPSTGLGLFIVRSLVEAMGGEVELTNREPRGARFTLRLAQSSRGGS